MRNCPNIKQLKFGSYLSDSRLLVERSICSETEDIGMVLNFLMVCILLGV
jgi:hypothetical protein